LSISIQGEGAGIERPIVIKGAPTNLAGVALEHAPLRTLYPDAKLLGQHLTRRDSRSYDKMVIKFQDGQELPVFFDVTDFFGKQPQ